jgi:ribonuclease Z
VLLFDAGPGSTRVLGSSGVPMHAITDVFITYLHSDHFSDLGELTVASEILGRDVPLTVHGPPGIEQVTEGFTMAYAIDHDNRSAQHPGHLSTDNARLRPEPLPLLTEAAVIFSADGIEVSAFPVDHAPVRPAYGYRISYGGRDVVISGDTAYFEPLADYARDADMLIHEAMDKVFAEQIARVADRIGEERTGALIRDALPNHSTPSEAGRIAAAAGVDTLVLTHISPPLITPLIARRFVSQARAAFDGEVILAEDGLKLDIKAR